MEWQTVGLVDGSQEFLWAHPTHGASWRAVAKLGSGQRLSRLVITERGGIMDSRESARS